MTRVQKIRKMDMENWTTTRIFLRRELEVDTCILPIRAFTGLKRDRKKAGYNPARKPIRIDTPKSMTEIFQLFNKLMLSSLPDRLLK
jgi:hypothetical protein